MRGRRVALVEIGTNSSKLTVAETGTADYRVLYAARRTTRLGSGLERGGRIEALRLAEAVSAARSFRRAADERGCGALFAFATYALRRASNAREVRRALEAALGAPLRILSGRQEARFAYLSARSRLPLHRPVTVLADIGGGSTELVVARRGRVVFARSIPLGALHLTERFIRADPIDASEFAALEARVEHAVASVLRSARLGGTPARDIDLAASGGAVGALSWVIASRGGARPAAKGLPRRIALGEASRFLDRCLAVPLEERRRIRGLEPDRAEIVCAGLAVALRLMRGLRKRALVPNHSGVRDGALLHLIRNGCRW
jgi:exopolyphosphatase/guanosine-5'-triphosphate,3'-diphosphate pyrophosphatase